MSTPGDEERLLSDSSVTEDVENQVDDVDKQLIIKNIVAEELEEEEEKKGDNVGINVPARGVVAQVNFTGETPEEDFPQDKDNVGMNIPGRSVLAQVHNTSLREKTEEHIVRKTEAHKDIVAIEVPGRSVVECVDPAKQKAVDTPPPHDPYQISGPLPPDPYQPAAPLYNSTPSTLLPPEGDGLIMKTTPLDDSSTAVVLVSQGKEEREEVNTQKEAGEQEEARTHRKEGQEAKTQEEEQKEARTQEQEEPEAETQEEEQEVARTQEKEKQEAETQEEEKEETQKEVEEQEEAKITEREQETAGSPPTYAEAPDYIPPTSTSPPQPPPPNQDPPQPPPPNRDPSQQVPGPLLPPDPLQINQTEISDVPSASESSQRRKDSPAVRLLRLIALLQNIAMELGDMAPEIGDLHELTSALKSSHRAPKESGSNLESCLCCSCSHKNYTFGYKCSKIKRKSLKDGFSTALKQWNTRRKYINLPLLLNSGKILIYVALLAYHSTQLGSGIQKSLAIGFILFVALPPFVSTFGVFVALVRWLFFYIRNRKKIHKSWGACCCLCLSVLCSVCKCLFCCCTKKKKDDESRKAGGSTTEEQLEESTSGEEKDSHKKGEESKSRDDEDSAKTKEKEGIKDNSTDNHSTCASICGICDEWQSTIKRFNSSPGRMWIILGNISGSLFTVLDEILGTVTFILTLYAFIGNESFHFHLFTAVDYFGFASGLLLPTVLIIFSRIIRVRGIHMNIKNLDRGIDSIPDEDIKRSQSEKIFSFQHGIIFHAVALGCLQLWFLVALSWKIIRDHCLSQSEALQLGILTNNTEVYVGPLANCSVPDLQPNSINHFTIINIIYITVILPILSYLMLFISNLPYLVEYTQRLHASGLYKVEEMLNKALPGDERGIQSGIYQFFSIFFEIINVKPDKAFLLTKKKEIVDLRKAVQEDMLGYYKRFGRKFEATLSSIPTVAFGVIHVALFLMNIGFLSCRYSLATNSLECSSRFDSFGPLTGSLASDEALLITPLLILFFLTGFPGPVITMLWIFVFIGVLMLIALVNILIFAVVIFIFIIAFLGSSSTTKTRYYHY